MTESRYRTARAFDPDNPPKRGEWVQVGSAGGAMRSGRRGLPPASVIAAIGALVVLSLSIGALTLNRPDTASKFVQTTVSKSKSESKHNVISGPTVQEPDPKRPEKKSPRPAKEVPTPSANHGDASPPSRPTPRERGRRRGEKRGNQGEKDNPPVVSPKSTPDARGDGPEANRKEPGNAAETSDPKKNGEKGIVPAQGSDKGKDVGKDQKKDEESSKSKKLIEKIVAPFKKLFPDKVKPNPETSDRKNL